jgi:hypothetical protein
MAQAYYVLTLAPVHPQKNVGHLNLSKSWSRWTIHMKRKVEVGFTKYLSSWMYTQLPKLKKIKNWDLSHFISLFYLKFILNCKFNDVIKRVIEFSNTFLRLGSAAACLLGLWVRIRPGALISVVCGCCVSSGRSLASNWSLVQRSSTEFRVFECDR